MAAELAAENQIYLAAGVVLDTYQMFSKTPINSLADLEGKKVAGAGYNLRYLEGIKGAAGVRVGLPSCRTKLTHAEWLTAIEFLERVGDITTPTRNEYVLLSDVTRLSSLVDMIGSQHEGTSSSVLGPFHILGAPDLPVGGDLKQDNDGATVIVKGRVRTPDGTPIKGAVIESWQTADTGLYSNVDETQDEYNLRCSIKVGDDGLYSFTSIRPAPYMVPDDGPAGDLLHATGRDAWRPSHFHFIVVAEGYKSLVTEVFPSDDP
jgi:hydroxyquinol 1,2-dioxygenase